MSAPWAAGAETLSSRTSSPHGVTRFLQLSVLLCCRTVSGEALKDEGSGSQVLQLGARVLQLARRSVLKGTAAGGWPQPARAARRAPTEGVSPCCEVPETQVQAGAKDLNSQFVCLLWEKRQCVRGKTLSIIHQGNANQHHNETPHL